MTCTPVTETDQQDVAATMTVDYHGPLDEDEAVETMQGEALVPSLVIDSRTTYRQQEVHEISPSPKNTAPRSTKKIKLRSKFQSAPVLGPVTAGQTPEYPTRRHRSTLSENISSTFRHPINELILRRSRSAAADQYFDPVEASSVNEKDVVVTNGQDPSAPTRSDSARNQERLAHKLRAAVMEEDISHRRFLPKGALEMLVTQLTVVEELKRFEYIPSKIRHRTRGQATFVPGQEGVSDGHASRAPLAKSDSTLSQSRVPSYRRIFAILVLIDRPAKIFSFVKEKVCDDDLPLTKRQRSNYPLGEFELRRNKKPGSPVRCLKNQGDISSFEERQWWVLVPTFDAPDLDSIPHCSVLSKQVLPFVHWDRRGKTGGFGVVHQATLHSDHHVFDAVEAPGSVVAVKKLLTNDAKAFKRESQILNSLSRGDHRHHHLIRLLATYEQHDYFFLVLPWAEKDLEQYWETTNPRSLGEDDALATWLIEQCQGLAEALSKIHNYETILSKTFMPFTQSEQPNDRGGSQRLYGRHGDIKPKNILWFPKQARSGPYGVLKITDFGVARFSVDNGVPMRERSSIPNSLTYRSPECQLPEGKLSMQCDVWALGCVYLVFLCWYFGGCASVKRFDQDRSYGHDTNCFFNVERDDTKGTVTAKVKRTVIEMMENLRRDCATNADLLRILDHIQNDMLVIHGPSFDPCEARVKEESPNNPGGLVVPPHIVTRRKSSSNIARMLRSIMRGSSECD